MEILFDPQKNFDCHVCQSKYPQHPQREGLLERHRASKNCIQEGERAKFKSTHGLVTVGYRRCPGNYYAKWVEHLLSFMDLGGSWQKDFEMPAKTVELLAVIESTRKGLEFREAQRHAKHSQSRC